RGRLRALARGDAADPRGPPRVRRETPGDLPAAPRLARRGVRDARARRQPEDRGGPGGQEAQVTPRDVEATRGLPRILARSGKGRGANSPSARGGDVGWRAR